MKLVTKHQIEVESVDIDAFASRLRHIAAQLEGMRKEAVVIDADTEEALDSMGDSLDFLANRSQEIRDAIDSLVQLRWQHKRGGAQ